MASEYLAFKYMSKYCPHCNAEIDNLKYEARITSYGTAWGECDLNGDGAEEDDCEYNDTDYDDYTYRCPDCEEEVDTDDLLDEPDGDDEDDDFNSDDEEISCCADEISVETLTDGGCRVVKRGSSTEGARTEYAYGIKTKVCPSCGVLNFTEDDSAIICLSCNAEIIIN